MSGWQHLVSPYRSGLTLIQFDALKFQKFLKKVCTPNSVCQLVDTIHNNCNAIVYRCRIPVLDSLGENRGTPSCRRV